MPVFPHRALCALFGFLLPFGRKGEQMAWSCRQLSNYTFKPEYFSAPILAKSFLSVLSWPMPRPLSFTSEDALEYKSDLAC